MKHKFETLDGLRGIAAIAVLLFHRREWFGGPAFFGHAFLAVDFFFMLSGFVIAHAYEARLSAPGSLGGFVRDRVIRLHPLLALGSALGCAAFAIKALRAGEPLPFGAFAASFVPFPVFWANMESCFPINLPTWSLFWELLVNLVFALTVRRLTNSVLIAIIAASAIAMIGVSIPARGFQVGLDNPWLLWGIPRVCVSFFAGVLMLRLFRAGRRLPFSLGWMAPLLLLASFLLPHDHPLSWLYDPLIVFLLYPVILMSAAATAPALPRLTRFSADLSYPLYVLHVPILSFVALVFAKAGLTHGTPDMVRGAAILLVTVAICYAAGLFYDVPVRRFLRARWGSRSHRDAPLSAVDPAAAGR